MFHSNLELPIKLQTDCGNFHRWERSLEGRFHLLLENHVFFKCLFEILHDESLLFVMKEDFYVRVYIFWRNFVKRRANRSVKLAICVHSRIIAACVFRGDTFLSKYRRSIYLYTINAGNIQCHINVLPIFTVSYSLNSSVILFSDSRSRTTIRELTWKISNFQLVRLRLFNYENVTKIEEHVVRKDTASPKDVTLCSKDWKGCE